MLKKVFITIIVCASALVGDKICAGWFMGNPFHWWGLLLFLLCLYIVIRGVAKLFEPEKKEE